MLKKLLKTFNNLFPSKVLKKPVHKVSAKNPKNLGLEHVSKNALEVIKALTKAGHKAYLVGGCIRDLILSISPKDFDVATDATPEQVRRLFRNSRVIGRRFKLVHVFWGREIIEVATFRGPHRQEEATSESALNSSGRILRDNVYSTIEDDAQRRDFTINALYLDVVKGNVLDYVDGLEDIKNKLIRLIGKPDLRYKEDPVRMLRAVRFAAKLDFKIEEKTEAAIYKQAHLLKDIPAARLFDEILKLFLSNKALRTFELLTQYQLFAPLFPMVTKALKNSPAAEAFIRQALTNTDERLQEGKTINPAFLYATFLWPVLLERLPEPFSTLPPDLGILQELANEIIAEQNQYTTIPKRFSIPMREIWEMQVRLTRRQGRRADSLLASPRFRAGYDFLLLRESVGVDTNGLGQWWTIFQTVGEAARRHMIRKVSGADKKVTARRRRYNKAAKLANSKDSSSDD